MIGPIFIPQSSRTAAAPKIKIRTFIAPVLEMSEKINWDIHQIAEDDRGNVFTERTDKFLINGKWVELPVCGVMTFSDGLMTHWRDYFDLMTFEKAMEEATALY